MWTIWSIHQRAGAIEGRGGGYLYEPCQPIWWFCRRLSCVFKPLLEGIHAKLLQLILNLLLLAPVKDPSYLPAAYVASAERLRLPQCGSSRRLQLQSTPDDGTQLIAARIEGSALLLIASGHAAYRCIANSGLMTHSKKTAGPFQRKHGPVVMPCRDPHWQHPIGSHTSHTVMFWFFIIDRTS